MSISNITQGKCIRYTTVLLKDAYLWLSLVFWLLTPALGLVLSALNGDELSEKLRMYVFAHAQVL